MKAKFKTSRSSKFLRALPEIVSSSGLTQVPVLLL